MNQSFENLLAEHQALEIKLADPDVFGDQGLYLELNKKYAELSPLANIARELIELHVRLDEAHVLVDDPDLGELAQADIVECETRIAALEAEFEHLTLPKDPADARDVIFEIRAGTGGAEAGLFAADLYGMYEKYAAKLGFKLELLDSNESDIGGFSKITFEVRGTGAFGIFKFEMGVHRVQRIPATETQGRIHTSTATVAVMPEAEDVDLQINMSDVRVDVYRSGGHGGQGVNTTDSAVRLTYKAGTPDEMVVTCQDGRSQLKNKEKAFTVLRSRLFEIERERIHRERSQNRASQVGSGDRSEKIRTYNYPQNRVTDHRLEGEEKNNPLESVMLGNLEPITEGLKALERLELLASKVGA
jgi:peptide chain release factor 1